MRVRYVVFCLYYKYYYYSMHFCLLFATCVILHGFMVLSFLLGSSYLPGGSQARMLASSIARTIVRYILAS